MQNYHRTNLMFLFFVFLLSIPPAFLSAQTCAFTPANRTLDLRQPWFPQIAILTRSYKTTSNIKTIGGDVKYAEDFCDNVVNSCDYTGSAFMYDVYYPQSADYASCPLPALFLFHGGGYAECAGYKAEEMIRLSVEFAKRGFVVFNVEYRRGVIISPDSGFYTAQQMLAIYRAAQDARGAIRSAIIRQREAKTYREPYSIDTSNIFIGGMSAGSVTALNVAYYQQQAMIDKVMPGIRQALGNVNADYYLGDTTIGYKIKGVLNLWGGALLSNADTTKPSLFFQDNAYLPPMIAFCGEQDATFNYIEQPLYLVQSNARYPITRTPLSYETRCVANGVTYQLQSSYPKPDGAIFGADNMYKTLNGMRVPVELYLDSKMAHGLSTGDIGEKFFGLGFTDIDSTLSYIAQRGATFFQAVINGYAFRIGNTMFKDCENYRYANRLANDNDCNNAPRRQSFIAAAKSNAAGANNKPVVDIHPNPAKEMLNLQIKNLPAAATVEIRDADGRLLLTKKITSQNRFVNNISFAVGSLSSGVYYLKLICNGDVLMSKWIKE